MQFSSDKIYPNLLNLSVSGATLEDYLAIGVLAVNKFQPKVMYVGVEPWLFNSKNDDDRWREIQGQYHESVALMNGRLGTITHRADNYSYLFSLYKSVNVSLSSISVNDEIGDQDKIRKDGSRLYSIARSNLSPIEVNRTIQEYGFYNMDNFEFDSTRYVKFIRFIKYIQRRDVKVIFVLSPYHPDLYYLIQKQKKEILFMEGLFKRLATSLNIQTKGSYNPEYCNCGAKSFYDAIHPKAECIKEKVILCE